MSSLVLELQKEAMDGAAFVAGVLRKAMVVAAKLDVPEFRAFCEKELSGYADDETPPDYRRVQGRVMVRNPFHGWQPVQIENPAAAKRISERYVNQSIAELEDLIRGTTDGDSTLQMPFSPELLNHWRNEEFMRLGLEPTLIVSKTAICGIVDRVRNAVLDWSLQLEEQGVLGNGMTFTSTEKQNAGAVVYNIQNVTGVVGGSITADNLQIMSFSSIHAELKQLGIGQEGRNELETIMDALPAASPEEKPSLLQSGLDWIDRNKEVLGALNAMLVAWFKGFS